MVPKPSAHILILQQEHLSQSVWHSCFCLFEASRWTPWVFLCAHKMRHTCKEMFAGFPFCSDASLPSLFAGSPRSLAMLPSSFDCTIGLVMNRRLELSQLGSHPHIQLEREEGKGGSLPVRILAGCPFGTADPLLPSTGAPQKSHRELNNSGAYISPRLLRLILNFKGHHAGVLVK